MAKTKPNPAPAPRRNRKSKVDKSKSKLKRLLDAKGIAIPVATQSDEMNQLVERILPKHPAGFRNHRKPTTSIEIKKETNEGNRPVAPGYKSEAANGNKKSGPRKVNVPVSNGHPTAPKGTPVKPAENKINQTTSSKPNKSPGNPQPNNISAGEMNELSKPPVTKPKKSVKRLNDNSIKTHLSQKSILASIAQTLAQPTTLPNIAATTDTPLENGSNPETTMQTKPTPVKPRKSLKRLSGLPTKAPAKLSAFKVDSIEPDQVTNVTKQTNVRISGGFHVEEIVEQTIVTAAPSNALVRYSLNGVSGESSSDNAPAVEEVIDEMILPDVRRGFTSHSDDYDSNEDSIMDMLYGSDSDGWEDDSTGESSWGHDTWSTEDNSDEDSELSIGSGAEEILSDGQSFSSDSDSCPELVGLDETNADSDDSCPQLVPIGNEADDSDSQPPSDFSGYSQFSCDHSDCCGHSEGSSESYETDDSMDTYDSEDVEEEESEDDDGWIPVSPQSSSNDDEDYSSIDSDLLLYDEERDISYDEDPHFFETDRKPIIVSAGETRGKAWSKLPLDLNQSLNHTAVHDTSIEQIVRRVRLSKPKETIALEEPATSSDESESENQEDESLDAEPTESADEEPDSLDNEPEIEPQLEETIDAPESEQFNDNHNENGPTPHPSATFRPRFFNSLDSRQVLLVLKSDIHFHGILKVTLLAGNARIYGYSLRPNTPVTACSPRGHSFVSIEPEKTKNSDDEAQKSVYLDTVQQILTSMQSDFINQDIYTAIECFDPAKDVLLLLEPAERQLNSVNMIQRYMRQSVFPNMQTFKPGTAFYSTEFILRTKFFLVPRSKLRFGPEWNTLPLDASSRSLVIGGKGVGKSTFVRYAANVSVQKFGRVLLVDLDIGQPEIFVPQTISATLLTEPILGPGYLQNKTPDRALLFGEINVTVSPLKYFRCVLQLLQYCASRPEYANVPWIINTMGYNKGFGPELVAAMLRAFGSFTDLVQIQAHRFLDNYGQIMNADVVNAYGFNFFHAELNAFPGRPESVSYRTHVFPSMARRFGEKSPEWDMSAKDSRFAIVLSNLGAMLKDGCEWITDLKPVCTSLANIKVIASDAVSPDQHLRLLNGNLVYLCRLTDENVDNVECFGIGIVRAVDPDTNKIYLLPATTDANLARTNALAVCNSPLPASLLTNHNRRVTGRVPYVYCTDNFIGSKHVVHIGYRPDMNR